MQTASRQQWQVVYFWRWRWNDLVLLRFNFECGLARAVGNKIVDFATYWIGLPLPLDYLSRCASSCASVVSFERWVAALFQTVRREFCFLNCMVAVFLLWLFWAAEEPLIWNHYMSLIPIEHNGMQCHTYRRKRWKLQNPVTLFRQAFWFIERVLASRSASWALAIHRET